MFLDNVRDYLLASGVVGRNGSGWPIFIGYLPDDLDRCVALFPTGGFPADTLGRENLRPTFQTRVRSSVLDFAGCYAQWEVLFNLLQDANAGMIAASPDPLETFVYIQAMKTSPLQFNDSKQRPNMTANWRVMKLR